ncbi:MAG: mechanosensitive ion channel [Saprospiraceae bacterium]|nr:mechanosensitive ion channel [Saprospiraceae bacterium]
MIAFKFLFKIIVLLVIIALKEGLGSEMLETWIDQSAFFRSLLNFGIFWLSLNVVIRLTQYIYRKRKKLGHKYSDNVIIGLRNIYYLLTVMASFFLMIGMFGLHPKELLTALSIVAAALAIISKELVMDVICGINFSFSRDIAIGDYVKINDKEGRVHDLNIHKIVLSNNNQLINIPNSSAYFSDIINYSSKENFCLNMELDLPVSVVNKRQQLDLIIQKASRDLVPEMLINEIQIHLSKLTKDTVSLSIDFNFKHADKSISLPKLKDKILLEVLKMMDVSK